MAERVSATVVIIPVNPVSPELSNHISTNSTVATVIFCLLG
jgi:type VI protein secretion system component Hcp